MEMEALQFAVWSGLILVGGGGLLFWLTSPDGDDNDSTPLSRGWRRVKPFTDRRTVAPSSSVKSAPVDHPPARSFPVSVPTETEKRAETETPETDPEKVIITRERFDTLQQQARDEGMAYAFGLLHGAGLLDPAIDREKRLTEVKELVFAGFSGRRMSTLINPQIRAGFDEGQRRKPVQPAELRTVKVAGGEREVVL